MAGGELVDGRVCSSTAAMRRTHLFGRLRLSVILLLAYLTYATSQTEKYIVCKKPDSKMCLVWTTDERDRNYPNTIPSTIVVVYCGFSNISPNNSSSKYIKVDKTEKISSRAMFCGESISQGTFLNWTEVANVLEKSLRVKRQSFIPRGRYRGQTQSQYLAIDRGNGNDEGKAEAHSDADSSRASVSGNSGMGQAQSQSIYDPSCDDCNGKTNQEIENLKRPSGLKPGTQYDPSVDSTWSAHVGPNNIPDKSYTQTSPDHYGSSYRPSPGQLPPVSKGNGNEIYGPQGTGANRPGVGLGTAGPVGPGTIEDSNYRPSTTNGGYNAINYPGGTSYQPIGGQGGNGFNRDPSSIAGTPFNNYRPQKSGNNNYIPDYNVNKYGNHPGNVIPGYGNNFRPQNGVANFGSGEPKSNTNKDSIGGISNPSTSQISSGYLPGSHISDDSSRTHGPEIGLNQRETGLTHWPLANGPYPGPVGSNVYCCIVPNNVQNGNLYPNNIYSSDKIPIISGKSSNIPYVPSGGANNLMAPSGQYGPNGYVTDNREASYRPIGQYGADGTGTQYGPRNIGTQVGSNGNVVTNVPQASSGTGTDTFPITGNHYEGGKPYGSSSVGGASPPDGRYQSPDVQYRPTSTGGSLIPTGKYVPTAYNPGSSSGPRGQYGQGSISSPTGSLSNGGQYGLVDSGRPAGPNGQYEQGSPGSSVGSGGQYPGGQYIPGGAGGLYTPSASEAQYPASVGQGPIDGAVRYEPGNPNTQIGPNGQYGSGSTVGPGQQYGPGGSMGQYLPGNIGGQYSPGSVGVQYTPGNTGQYIPGSSGTSVSPGGHYGPGNGIENGGQYGAAGPDNQYSPGRPHIIGSELPPGSVGVHPENSGQYGPGNYGIPSGPNNKYNSVPENFVDPNSVSADGDDSEAEAIIAQNLNGTTASASSKGGNDKGRAQTNVQGTYTGSGSFQAQAQIIGENKEAQSEVNGGKKGASSSATGSGRNNKSHANVQLGSETGSIQTQSQSNGVMHSSNSQVQGSVKGGMADAQARGPGSTSSQAQIGFTPYKDEEKNTHDRQKLPFIGGGMASAQSSGRTGQSQSQLHGTFKYGISYNGAAQSGASLNKDAIFPNRLSFEKIDVFDEKNKNINVDKLSIDDATELPQPFVTEPPAFVTSTSIFPDINNTDEAQTPTTENILDESMTNSESRFSGHSHMDHHVFEGSNKTNVNESSLLGSRRSFQTNYPNIPDYEFTTDRDDTQPEYDTDAGFDGEANEASDVEQAEYSNYDEYTRDSSPQQYLRSPSRKGMDVQQTTGGNTQHIVLGSLKDHNAEIIQRDTERPDERKVYQPGERVPGTGGYTIPVGFTGSVKSVASKDKTFVVGSKDSPSQAQTVTLTPGTGKVKYTHPSSYGKYVKPKYLRSLQSPKENENKYVSVSKSVTRDLDSDNNIRKQYSHTYYTKSSSCGYFTFTCTMVSSAEGRKKVCKPKMPTNPDGTPIRC